MIKILILSDSHGLTEEIIEISNRHQVDYKVHCGDSELTKNATELAGFITIAGNCDQALQFPEEQIIDLESLTCFVTHGHLYGVNSNLLRLSYRAQEMNAQVMFYGHTHIANVEKIGNTLFVNPGSIRMSRNRLVETYAILQWKKKERKLSIEFYTLNGDQLYDLSYETSMKA